jgi:hypothetical protein
MIAVYIFRVVCSCPSQIHIIHLVRLASFLLNRGVPGLEPETGQFTYVFRGFTQFSEANSGFLPSTRREDFFVLS